MGFRNREVVAMKVAVVGGHCSWLHSMAEVTACPRGEHSEALPLSQWLVNVLAAGAQVPPMSHSRINTPDRWSGSMISVPSEIHILMTCVTSTPREPRRRLDGVFRIDDIE